MPTNIVPLRKARERQHLVQAPEVLPGMLTAFEQLRPLEKVFVRAYVATDDPIKAILAVSPELKGNSLANVRALDYMRRPLVSAAIAQENQRILSRYEVTAENVVQEIALMAFARMGDYATPNEDGSALQADFNKIPEQQLEAALAAVSEFTYDEETDKDGNSTVKFKFKLHDKGASLDKLMKRLGAYAPERSEISGPGGGPIKTLGAVVTRDMTVDEAKRIWEEGLDG